MIDIKLFHEGQRQFGKDVQSAEDLPCASSIQAGCTGCKRQSQCTPGALDAKLRVHRVIFRYTVCTLSPSLQNMSDVGKIFRVHTNFYPRDRRAKANSGVGGAILLSLSVPRVQFKHLVDNLNAFPDI